MMLTRFLPMSWTSPLTVPITTVPIDAAPVSASSGRRMSSAPCHRLRRDEHLGDEEVAALEPGADLLERRDQRLVQQRLRAQPHGQALVGQLEHGKPVADQRSRRRAAGVAPLCVTRATCLRLLASVLARPAGVPAMADGSSAGGRGRRTARWPAPRTGPPRPKQLGRGEPGGGPDTDSAATTAPPSRRTGRPPPPAPAPARSR